MEVWVFIAALTTFAAVSAADETPDDLYLKEVKPILAARCFPCHGTLKQESGLRLDAISEIRRGGDSGELIVAGNSAQSLLIARVTAAENERMPAEGEPLSEEQIAILKRWIDRGANAADEPLPSDPRDHWAFQPPIRPQGTPLPGASVNAIDFILKAKHEAMQLSPVPVASKRTLLRRLYFDVVGLPPTPAEVNSFVADNGPHAYEDAVDRLLDSPHYGERWGRHWMDIWRYAEGFGLGAEIRFSQPHMWRFRDWIIDSLNADKGYDQMIIEMLAADEVTTEAKTLAANGFVGRHWNLFNRNVWMDNVVDSTARGLLGLTMNCARCHDHKYDPITQKDYYRLRAFFEPHKLRTDRIPGQSEGVSRAYDAELDAPTYLFERGDEQRANKEEILSPAPPAVLTSGIDVQPLSLPLEAYYPGFSPMAQAESITQAWNKVTVAQSTREQAASELIVKRHRLEQFVASGIAPVDVPDSSIVQDTFLRPRPDLWQPGVGEWDYIGDGLLQKRSTGPQCQLITQEMHPRDFVVTMTLQILGGATRAVGLAFDKDNDGFVGVFLSPTDSKVQTYYIVKDQEIYPEGAIKHLSVENGNRYELTVAVRDRSVRIWVNGIFMLSHSLLNERHNGRFALTTFESATKFSHFRLSPLPKDVLLDDAGSLINRHRLNSEADLRAEATMADLTLRVAMANEKQAHIEYVALKCRLAAEQVRIWGAVPAVQKPLAFCAHILERLAKRASVDAKLVNSDRRLALAKGALKHGGKPAEEEVAAAKNERSALEKELSSEKKQRTAPFEYSTIGPVYPVVSSGRRLALARWVGSRNNPLTARVAVNHIWTRHFGDPLVESMFDFGLRTPKPQLVDILDCLAVDFMDSGWKMKSLHRTILTSEAYRRTSSNSAENQNARIDPDNRFFWRMNTRRLEAEIIRDSLLQLSGRLDPSFGGPSLPVATAAKGSRRTIYYRYAREPSDKVPVMNMFDAPNVEECFRRQDTIVPQQALMMSNSGMTLQAATDIVARIETEMQNVGQEIPGADFISIAFDRLLGRPPTDDERAVCDTSLARLYHISGETLPPDVAQRRAEKDSFTYY